MTANLAALPERDDPLDPVVLIVNSDEVTRSWIEATVTSIGLRAISVDSGRELLSRFPPDSTACAILDVVLPDTSAFELQEHLTRAGASVLFLTRQRCISLCVRALKAGAVDFLTLPCEASELVCSLRHALRHALTSRVQRQRLDELHARYQRLTPREQEVFALVTSGLLNKLIAERLEISEITVQTHRGRVMAKMRARSLAALVRMADALQAPEPSCCTQRQDSHGSQLPVHSTLQISSGRTDNHSFRDAATPAQSC